jgi:glycosyltransferase involved in cell wall biosynthesis
VRLRPSRLRKARGARVLGPPLDAGPDRKVVRFYRTYRSFHGGHLKVFDYFNHVRASGTFTPQIVFSPDSVWDASNPWASAGLVEVGDPGEPDVHFLAGRDWVHLDDRDREASPIPVVNFIQHVRHAEPGHPLSPFLRNRAIRIAVSHQVADAITAAGANGPVHTIPNGIDLDDVLPHEAAEKTTELLIVANKKPELGREIQERFPTGSVLIDEMVPRDGFLDEIGRARVALFCPNDTEGFYLPALEAMALGAVVVCPDVVGNRSFCLPGRTAFRPAYSMQAIVDATRSALDADRGPYVDGGREMAASHDLQRERARFLEILEGVDGTWKSLR